ncbi:DUF6093 family protein [Nocardioides sp. LHG3406-4]|uniref:DUF6093 family protein n=1 Tax=Nocardioides sp. LHG3406-4 TaxID=2804575 RepID=UPI003CECBB88
MGLPETLARGRAMAEARMTDTCRITRAGEGERVLNPETAQYEDPPPVVVYEGRCHIPKRAGSTSQSAGGDASWRVGEVPFELPIDGSEAVRVGMTVTYLTAAYDPELPGHVFGITEVAFQSQATKRRLVMKTITGS